VTVPTDLAPLVANVTNRLFAANQELCLLTRDRDATQELGPPSSPGQLDALARDFERRRIPFSPSYFAFLSVSNGWKDFVGESRILSTDDHAAAWIDAAIARREGLGSDEPLSHLVPVLLGSSPSSPAAFFDRSTSGFNSEPGIVAIDDRHGAMRLPSFLALLQNYLAFVELAVRQQREGD
jgi:hypothetical protein